MGRSQKPGSISSSARPRQNSEPKMEHASPPAAAVGVTATVDLSPAATDLGGAHLLPCGIRQNGGAPVSDYFKPRSTGPCLGVESLVSFFSPFIWLKCWCRGVARVGVEVEGVRVEEAFFRGRKLQGATLALPDGYRGEAQFVASAFI